MVFEWRIFMNQPALLLFTQNRSIEIILSILLESQKINLIKIGDLVSSFSFQKEVS